MFILLFQDSNRQRVNDLTYQMQVLEDELADSKLQCSKVNANAMAQKSNYEIAVSAENLTILNKSHQYSYFY